MKIKSELTIYRKSEPTWLEPLDEKLYVTNSHWSKNFIKLQIGDGTEILVNANKLKVAIDAASAAEENF